MVKGKQEMTRAEFEEANRKLRARDKKAAQRAKWKAELGREEYNKRRAEEKQNERANKKKELEEPKLAAEMNPSSALFKALENTNKTQLEYATIAQQGTENIFCMGGQFCKDNLATIASSLSQTSPGPSSYHENCATVTPPPQRTRGHKWYITEPLTRNFCTILIDKNNKHEMVNVGVNLFHEAFETYAPGVRPEAFFSNIRKQYNFRKEVWNALTDMLNERNNMIHPKNNGWIFKLDIKEFHYCVEFLLDELLPNYHLVHYNAEAEQLRREKEDDIEQLRREKEDEIAAYVSWENYKKEKELAQKDKELVEKNKIIAIFSRQLEDSKKRGRDDDNQDNRAAKRRRCIIEEE